MAVVSLSVRSLDVERLVTKRKQALIEVEQNLQIANNAALSTQHSCLAKAEEALNCRGDMENAEELLGVAQVAANKARDDSKVAKEETSEV